MAEDDRGLIVCSSWLERRLRSELTEQDRGLIVASASRNLGGGFDIADERGETLPVAWRCRVLFLSSTRAGLFDRRWVLRLGEPSCVRSFDPTTVSSKEVMKSSGGVVGDSASLASISSSKILEGGADEEELELAVDRPDCIVMGAGRLEVGVVTLIGRERLCFPFDGDS